ncbi:N-acetyltransferase [Streptomyces roseochromogenus]|nr:N-acetyltransferase [Streptomyces roseochromogenus]
MMQYTLTTDTTAAAGALDDLAALYETVFAEPPYLEGPRDVADFLDRYQREHRTPGFRLVKAHDDGGALAGFAYGLPLSSTTTWWNGLIDTNLPSDFTREDGHRTFVVMELAVLADRRGHRIGGTLHNLLLDQVDAHRVTLAVRPEAPAAAWYEHLGYDLVGMSRPWPEAPVYRVMVRTLPAAATSGTKALRR